MFGGDVVCLCLLFSVCSSGGPNIGPVQRFALASIGLLITAMGLLANASLGRYELY